jgi:DNA gyrase inhibitor GyrI
VENFPACISPLEHGGSAVYGVLGRPPRLPSKGRNTMNLTEQPEIVNWPATHYVFIEKTGPFMQNAGAAWQAAHALAPELLKHNTITTYMSLYKVGPKIYRAGFGLAAPPSELPEGFSYEVFPGGKYSRFTLTGPYTQLPQASGRVWELVSEQGIEVRDDFAIENYATDPRVTPEDQLITQILVPAA